MRSADSTQKMSSRKGAKTQRRGGCPRMTGLTRMEISAGKKSWSRRINLFALIACSAGITLLHEYESRITDYDSRFTIPQAPLIRVYRRVSRASPRSTCDGSGEREPARTRGARPCEHVTRTFLSALYERENDADRNVRITVGEGMGRSSDSRSSSLRQLRVLASLREAPLISLIRVEGSAHSR